MALSDAARTALAGFLETEAREWAKAYVLSRQAFLERRKITASGGLKESLAHEVKTALGNELRTNTLIQFDDHGRFIDMKRLKPPRGGGDYIAALEDWIQKKGLQTKLQTKFMEQRGMKTAPQNIVNQMAWGIAIKRFSGKKYKRRAWYARSSGGAINDLYNSVAAGMPDIVLQEIKAAFDQ